MVAKKTSKKKTPSKKTGTKTISNTEDFTEKYIKCSTCERKTPPVPIQETEKEITYKCLVCQNPFTISKKK